MSQPPGLSALSCASKVLLILLSLACHLLLQPQPPHLSCTPSCSALEAPNNCIKQLSMPLQHHALNRATISQLFREGLSMSKQPSFRGSSQALPQCTTPPTMQHPAPPQRKRERAQNGELKGNLGTQQNALGFSRRQIFPWKLSWDQWEKLLC